jgi:hypothetical protein
MMRLLLTEKAETYLGCRHTGSNALSGNYAAGLPMPSLGIGNPSSRHVYYLEI